VLLVSLPTAASREVVAATRGLDHVLVVAERDETARVDLVAALDALEAGGTTVQAMLVDDRTVQRLADPAGTSGADASPPASGVESTEDDDHRSDGAGAASPEAGALETPTPTDAAAASALPERPAAAGDAPDVGTDAPRGDASGEDVDGDATQAAAARSAEPEAGGPNGRGVRVVPPVVASDESANAPDGVPAAPDRVVDVSAAEPDQGGAGAPADPDPLPAPGDPAAATGPLQGMGVPGAWDPGPQREPEPGAEAEPADEAEPEAELEPEHEIRLPEHDVRPAPAPDGVWQTAGPDVPTQEVPAQELLSRDVEVLRDADAARAAAWIETERVAAERDDRAADAPHGDVAAVTSAWPDYDRWRHAETVPSLEHHDDVATDEVPEHRASDEASGADARRDDLDAAAAGDTAQRPVPEADDRSAAEAATAWDAEPVAADEVAGEDDPLQATAQLAILIDELHERGDDAEPDARP
jgi:hypothetical protein